MPPELEKIAVVSHALHAEEPPEHLRDPRRQPVRCRRAGTDGSGRRCRGRRPIGLQGRRLLGGGRKCLPAGLSPEAAALEWIGGQRQPPAPLAGGESRPVDRYAGLPQTSEGPQEDRLVLPLVSGVAHGGDGDRRRLRSHPPRQRAQGAPGSDLEKHRAAIRRPRQQALDTGTETHGLTQVPYPIGWISGFGGGDPIPGQVGEERDGRLPQLHLGHARGETGEDRLHHRRVERV